ncbi:pentatricopeptide repeat-containing protein At2g20710, mitochondrial-like [Lotus japonicus]|uniref:pentatricopeptide repeat-containing protein At2g20710, mitochondrial-like n=1 Tax=Lotus japonicus TaxID=34305 RepID=UPI002589EE92|nr:pentatricopeptide repeat-containing protein At2g20710, mitochondrial-like [Lotus japonicus]
MMLLRSRWKQHFNMSLVSRPFPLYYSTEAPVDFSALETRVLKSGDPRTPMAPILNQWVEGGGDITQIQLQRLITRLAYFRRFTHALQVSEWMSNERNYDLSSGLIAKRIHLISKVHGLKKAEDFFQGIPDDKRGFKIYASLLSCYAEHKSLEEAEAIMKKIKELRPMHLTVCYNILLKLYAQKGKYEKLDRLMQEMKENDLCNGATFTIRLNAYVAAKDVEGMEKLLMQMEADPMATVDWYTYSTAANGYLKAGNVEKALAALKKSEQSVKGKKLRLAYESLQSTYAAIGNKDEVYRLWNRIKNLQNCWNSSYICMLSSLLKLDDFDGAEKILAEWESEHKNFDTRIPNLMITAYCKRGLLDKAEAYIQKLLDSGKKLDGSSWDRMAAGYHMDNDMEKAVQTMKKAILANRPGWRPSPSTLVACITYLKEKLDLESALEILKLCKEDGHIKITTYDGLVSYAHGEIPDKEALDLMKRDYQMDGKNYGRI